jgi:uncharacterized protein YyaL (SSP411 family)
VEKQAKQIGTAVEASNHLEGRAKALDRAVFADAVDKMLLVFDEIQGGFGQAPKFPREPWLYLLLDQAERNTSETALQMLVTTLDHMARGGIHDQVGGGFHRYSTDYEWLVPHFEKMLYNQAHLSRIYLLAWRLSAQEQFHHVATRTLDYVLREMTHPQGGFYSATDADSEGGEGRFFTWTKAQISAALAPQDATLANTLYGTTPEGNFEGRNILHLSQSLDTYATEHDLTPSSLNEQLDRINQRLLHSRNQRPPPLRDDKLVTAWNGMMISAFAQAAQVLAHPEYRQAAIQAAEFVWQHNRHAKGRLWRVHLDGESSIPGTLDDYAYFAEALLYLYDLTQQTKWLERAEELAKALTDRFLDGVDNGFFMNEAASSITAMGRPKDDASDNAMPSGSSVALHVLQRLWQRTGRLDYRNLTDALVARFAPSMEANPTGYAYLLTAAANHLHGELGALAYAAQGAIRIEGNLTRTSDQLLLNVAVQIPEGWHINTDQPGVKDLIPTRLMLPDTSDGWHMGPVTYPLGELQHLAFHKQPLSVFSGKVSLQAQVSRDEKRSSTHLILPIALRLQACNDQVCLAPETLTLTLPPPR